MSNFTKQIIEKAKEGGYTGGKNTTKTTKKLMPSDLINPSFWQALGKALRVPCGEHTKRGYCVNCDGKGYHEPHYGIGMWHNFVDHIWKGKDPESFFKTLIDNNG